MTRWIKPPTRGAKRLLFVGLSVAAIGGSLLLASRTSGVLHTSRFGQSGADHRAHLGPVRLTPGSTVTFETWFEDYQATGSFPVEATLVSESGERKTLESTYQCDPGKGSDSVFRFGDFVPKSPGPWLVDVVMPAWALPRVSATLAVRDRAFDWTSGALTILMVAVFFIGGAVISWDDAPSPQPRAKA